MQVHHHNSIILIQNNVIFLSFRSNRMLRVTMIGLWTTYQSLPTRKESIRRFFLAGTGWSTQQQQPLLLPPFRTATTTKHAGGRKSCDDRGRWSWSGIGYACRRQGGLCRCLGSSLVDVHGRLLGAQPMVLLQPRRHRTTESIVTIITS
jgi:hypothetical protein